MNVYSWTSETSCQIRMATRVVLVCVLVVVVSQACGPGRTSFAASQSLSEFSLEVDGVARSYFIYVPPTTKSTPRPLVIVFHGGGGSGERIARMTGFIRVADMNNFIVAFPNAMEYWNDGRPATNSSKSDVEFVRQLISHLANTQDIDKRRVYATGMSNGGMLTLRLACEASASIAAFASVVASFPVQYASRCAPSQPVSIMMINGSADRLIKWGGGEIRKGRKQGVGGEVIPVPATVEQWRKYNRCAANAQIQMLPDKAPGDDTRVEVLSYEDCQSGSLVKLVKVIGGGHTWPGGPQKQGFFVRRLTGNTSQDINATEMIWEFFKDHKLP